jgi:hypothetical protein
MRHVNRGLIVSSVVALLLAGCAGDASDDSAVTRESAEAAADDVASEDDVAPGEATWTRVAAEESLEHVGSLDVEGELSDVAVTESGFVAVGVAEGNAAVWTSTDGVRWRRATQVPDTDPRGFSGGIALAEDGALAVTSRGPFGIGEVAVWSSASFAAPGRNWNRVVGGPAVFGDGTNVVDVTQGGPGWVAVGTERSGRVTSAAVWTADNEDSWTRVPHDDALFEGVMIGVTSGDRGVLAFGHTGGPRPVVWVSPDGSSWTRAPLDEALFDDAFPTPSRHAVVAGGPGWIAVGGTTTGEPFDWNGGPAAWTSVDGITWTRVPDDAFVGGPDERLVAVTATPSRLVAVGEGSSLWVSTDGVTWTNIPHGATEEPDGEPGITAAVLDDDTVIVVGAVPGVSVEPRPAVWNVTLPD